MIFQPQDNQSLYNLEAAFKSARESLSKIEVSRQCRNSGAELNAQGDPVLKYLNHNYRISLTTGEVLHDDSLQAVPIREMILILHYFLRAKGTPPTEKLITYRDLAGGMVYYPTFIKRTIKPLTDTFGKDAPLLVKAGESLGARKGDFGDASLIIDAFPRVPISIVLWQGDDELPPDLNMLYNGNISEYLETEDVTVISEIITWQLVNYVKKAHP